MSSMSTANGTARRSLEQSLAASLIAAGKLDAAALDRVLRLQAGSEERLEALLIKLGLSSERDIADAFAAVLGLAVADAGQYPAAPLFEDQLSKKFLRHAGALPLAETSEGVVLA